MSKADKLLKEVLNYRRGEGKYDFRYLCQYDAVTESRAAWQEIESRIVDYLQLDKTNKKSTM
jgi:hypothetical protein